jgi:hypothetical protein
MKSPRSPHSEVADCVDQVMRSRRSVRAYKPHPVPRDLVMPRQCVEDFVRLTGFETSTAWH